MELDTAKGTRDILPEDMFLREEIVATLQKIFSQYGFMPLDTPIIERYDVLSAKFAAGEESDAMQETYTLKDNGNRELGLRFDLTVPLSRFIGMNRTLKMPFKRYQIGKVYRDAPIKFGRYREFTQCDVDIIGSKLMISDVTCVAIAIDVYKAFDIDVKIKINNRKFLTALFVENGVPAERVESAMMTIDKLDKIDRDGVLAESGEKGFDQDTIGKIIDLMSMQGSNEERLTFFENMLQDKSGLEELREVLSFFPDDSQVVFSPTLARGLGYYTGTVFEVYAKENDSIGAIGGGGRYNELIRGYLIAAGQKPQEGVFPAVGISFGLDRMLDVLKKLNKVDVTKKTRTQVFIVPIQTQKECFSIAQEFRKAGINTDIDMQGKGPSKNLNYANTFGIPYVLIVGENELADGVVSLKNLTSGNEEKLSVKDAIQKVLHD